MSNSVWPHRRQPTRLPRPWDSPGKNTGVGCHFLLQCMKVKMKVKLLSRVRLFATPWTTSYQAPPSMGFSRQEYWSGVPLPSPTKFLLSHKWKRFFKRNKQNHPYNISLSREAEALHYILLHEIFTSWQQALPFWRQAVTRDMAEARVTAANLNLTQRTSGRKVTQLIWNHHCMVKE